MKPIKFTEAQLWLMYGIVIKDHLKNSMYKSKVKYNQVPFPPSATIYSVISPYRNKHALVLLSGGAQLENTPFIKKTIDDLDISDSHDIFVYENKRQLNVLCIDNIVKWIQMELQPIYDTLTLIGFSNGGLIASHTMYHLENSVDKSDFQNKTIISVDSMNNMYPFLHSYEQNKTYRQDIMGCYMTAFVKSLDHFHLLDRFDPLDIVKNTNFETAVQYFERMYDTNREDFQRITTFDYRIRNCKIVNIFSHYDPIIQRYYNEQHYEDLIRNVELEGKIPDIRSRITNIEFDMITHCSQMFDPEKSEEFASLLRQHLCT
jgi:hypothetical protein